MGEVSIINYGLGNVQSLKNALLKCGHKPIVTADINLLENSKKIILPGVGHFGFAMKKLNQLNLDKTIKNLVRENKKVIAICLGMQLLLETSEEAENVDGLGIFSGKVKKLNNDRSKESFPHVSWKKIYSKKEVLKLRNLFTKRYYFIHSYYCDVKKEDTLFESKYNNDFFASAIKKNNCIGLQFHPEKSGESGLKLLSYFLNK